jgi:hypothetical protein
MFLHHTKTVHFVWQSKSSPKTIYSNSNRNSSRNSNNFSRKNTDQKQWLKSYEVREMLGISRGTLQTLRTNGTLNATKIGGLMLYSYDDISKLMQGKKKLTSR